MQIKGSFYGVEKTEKLLSTALAGIRHDIAESPLADSITAVILGGSYGRGEGGSANDGGLCNDLDFFVLVPKFAPRKKIAAIFRRISAKWSEKLAIEVDFASPCTIEHFRRNAATLMIRDLLAAHYVIFGPADCFADIKKIPRRDLPFSEGARLLLNRGTGILLAEARLQQGMENNHDSEFIIRNLHKAALGCGDALLIANHLLADSGTERKTNLKRLKIPENLYSAYSEALNYKYRPDHENCSELSSWLNSTKKLFMETVSTFMALTTLPPTRSKKSRAHYARAIFRDVSNTIPGHMRNVILNILYFKKLPDRFLLTVHPRLKIFSMLLNALKNPEDHDLRKRYLELWHRFN
ncbi:MAG: nucleotidyltransferase domain-containing protein [Victivallaceae bacterium]